MAMMDPYAMQPAGAGGMPPDMGMVPPGPGMMPPEAEDTMDLDDVPPGPEQMLGATPEMPPVTVPGWVPADTSIPVDENTCAEINAIPYQDEMGKPFCLVPPPGGGPPGGGLLGPLG